MVADARPRCPSCRRVLPPEGPEGSSHRPFCSKRCRMADLGKWLDGEYRIPGPAADPWTVEGEERGDAEE